MATERKRLSLKPRDEAAAQKAEQERLAKLTHNPFGDAKPREVILAHRTGKTEEEILKEAIKKERLRLRLNQQQLQEKEEMEALVDEVKQQLQEAGDEDSAKRGYQLLLQEREAALDALMDKFAHASLEAAQRGEVQRPSERRQQQQQAALQSAGSYGPALSTGNGSFTAQRTGSGAHGSYSDNRRPYGGHSQYNARRGDDVGGSTQEDAGRSWEAGGRGKGGFGEGGRGGFQDRYQDKGGSGRYDRQGRGGGGYVEGPRGSGGLADEWQAGHKTGDSFADAPPLGRYNRDGSGFQDSGSFDRPGGGRQGSNSRDRRGPAYHDRPPGFDSFGNGYGSNNIDYLPGIPTLSGPTAAGAAAGGAGAGGNIPYDTVDYISPFSADRQDRF